MIFAKVVTVLFTAAACQACITLLDNKWRPHTIQDRAAVAEVVLSTRTLSKFPIPNSRMRLYGATFEVLSILKGWSKIEELLEKGSPSVRGRDKLTVSALGFGDRRHCWSSVDIGESYILFLSVNNITGYLVAKYLGEFGAAELLYAPSEDAILLSLGWRPWSTWSSCSQSCGGGVRRRTRKCISPELCRGPREETIKCNRYTCHGAVDILRGIENENINTRQSKLFRNHSLFGNKAMPPPSAMTYLMFPQQFPSEFSLLVRFKAALYIPRYVFSLYDANNRMMMGLKLGPGVITFHYGGQNDVSQDRSSHSFAADFKADEWRHIGVSVSSSQVRITENCDEIGRAPLKGPTPDTFDIFGAIYIGADINEGASRNFLGEVSQLTIVSDPTAISNYCGRQLLLPSQRRTRQPSPPYLGRPALLPTIKDTDSSGMDENHVDQENAGEDEQGSGRAECVAQCLNGGRCVNLTQCSCQHGWTGRNCEKPVCNPPCENGGSCLSPGKCKCPPRFGGPSCQKAICNPPCLNGGVCTSKWFKCKCPEGYFGRNCQLRKCRRYITKLVSYFEPGKKAKLKEYTEPCGILKIWKCKRSQLVIYKTRQVAYRQEYVCAN